MELDCLDITAIETCLLYIRVLTEIGLMLCVAQLLNVLLQTDYEQDYVTQMQSDSIKRLFWETVKLQHTVLSSAGSERVITAVTELIK